MKKLSTLTAGDNSPPPSILPLISSEKAVQDMARLPDLTIGELLILSAHFKEGDEQLARIQNERQRREASA